ncbi:hypothetical protein HAX54_038109 [Datura stramonium]|uniref:Uncharacterized protein n=1 Tax=Datura stramonium TaxID=4076 RepID=A0ABS8VKK8_DATST|nr:hypothetical protein [Datura stramonium]
MKAERADKKMNSLLSELPVFVIRAIKKSLKTLRDVLVTLQQLPNARLDRLEARMAYLECSSNIAEMLLFLVEVGFTCWLSDKTGASLWSSCCIGAASHVALRMRAYYVALLVALAWQCATVGCADVFMKAHVGHTKVATHTENIFKKATQGRTTLEFCRKISIRVDNVAYRLEDYNHIY